VILGFDILGNSFSTSTIPPRQSFSKIQLIGQQTVDELHIHNYELSDSTILALNSEEGWDNGSLLLAHLNGNTQGGNYTGLDTPIDHYLIEKRKSGDSQYTLVQNVSQSSGINQIKDYTSRNNVEYEYIIIPVDQNGIYGSNSTAKITQNFYGWFLVSQDNSICYKFDMEINTDNIQIVEDFKVFENYTQYAVTNQGRRRYMQGRLTTIPYSFNGQDYIIDVNVLNDIEAFINNKQPKYLKNTAGQIALVSTHNFSYKYYDQVPSQPYTVSFDFVQIGSGE
jgi:hypothetical protein